MLAKTYIFSLSYLLLTGTAWSQLAVFGDLYVSKKTTNCILLLMKLTLMEGK